MVNGMNHSWCKNIEVVPSLDHLWLIRSDGQHLVLLGMNALDLCFPLGYQFIWVVFIINVNNASMTYIYVGKLHSHLRDKRNIPFMLYSWAGGGENFYSCTSWPSCYYETTHLRILKWMNVIQRREQMHSWVMCKMLKETLLNVNNGPTLSILHEASQCSVHLCVNDIDNIDTIST